MDFSDQGGVMEICIMSFQSDFQSNYAQILTWILDRPSGYFKKLDDLPVAQLTVSNYRRFEVMYTQFQADLNVKTHLLLWRLVTLFFGVVYKFTYLLLLLRYTIITKPLLVQLDFRLQQLADNKISLH